MNKVILVGNVGQPPELKFIQNGTAVLSFSLATSERYQDKNTKEWHDKVEWHRIVVWGKYAEILNKNLAKGTLALVEGKLQTRSWEDKNGAKHYSTEIRADRVDLLARFGERADTSHQASNARSSANAGASAGRGHTQGAGQGRGTQTRDEPEPELGFGDDDIPF